MNDMIIVVNAVSDTLTAAASGQNRRLGLIAHARNKDFLGRRLPSDTSTSSPR
jgi:hypothetical protein